jgi:hypothetical protein
MSQTRYNNNNNNGENMITKEQKGCHSGTKGCKDQLLISKAMLQECKRRKKNLSIVWTDYHKALDRVPHREIIKSLQLIGINNKVISFVKKVMPTGEHVCAYMQNIS